MSAAELPVGADKARVVEAMFDRIAPRYELVNGLMTLGIDARWRRATVRALALPRRSRVVDLACGTGNLCRDLDAAGMCAVGVDIAAGMLSHARGAATFLRADVLRLPFRDAAFDGAVCGFALRNVVDLEAFFGECARVVRRSGRVAFLEVAQPRSAVLRGMHTMYFRRIVPLIGGALSDRAAYRYLPASTAYLPEPASLLAMVRGAGFSDVSRGLLTLGAAQLITGTRT